MHFKKMKNRPFAGCTCVWPKKREKNPWIIYRKHMFVLTLLFSNVMGIFSLFNHSEHPTALKELDQYLNFLLDSRRQMCLPFNKECIDLKSYDLSVTETRNEKKKSQSLKSWDKYIPLSNFPTNPEQYVHN